MRIKEESKLQLTYGRSFRNVRDLRRWVLYEHYNNEGRLNSRVAQHEERTWRDESDVEPRTIPPTTTWTYEQRQERRFQTRRKEHEFKTLDPY